MSAANRYLIDTARGHTLKGEAHRLQAKGAVEANMS